MNGMVARRLLRVVAGFAVAWLAARVLAPRLARAARRDLARRLARRTLASLDLQVRVSGRVIAAGPALVVANHVSWLDVQVLNTIFSARFVAKQETRTWPVIGAIARGFETFFLRRGSCRDAARVTAAVASALAAEDTVVVFPEGTTTDGTRLGRFHPAFFQAAVDAGVPLQPVAIRYTTAEGEQSLAASFVGDMTFVDSLLTILRERPLIAELCIGDVLAHERANRRGLAASAQASVAAALGIPAHRVETPAGLPVSRHKVAA